jgi:hypothetical protein
MMKRVEFTEGEWYALMSRAEHIHKEIVDLRYDLRRWARKGSNAGGNGR